LETTDLEQLRSHTLLATKCWGRAFAGLAAITQREKGERALIDLWARTLRSHQDDSYLDGLRKLGIRDDEPAAVKACKYHYFTNLIGGLRMEYIEESPKKCWIRYLAPMWTYSGLAMLAMPSHARRHNGRSWHARNGMLMGNDRLQYVKTKTITEGEPYDEAYWIEHDEPVPPDEAFIFKTEIRTPEFDPAKAPKLDPDLWPEERILKARSKFSAGYLSRSIHVLLETYGIEAAAYLVAQTMRGLAIQYIHELKADQRIEGADVQAVTALFAGILAACRQNFTVESVSPTKTRILLRTYKPFDWEVPEKLRDAYFEFQRMGGRILNGRLKISRSVTPEWGVVDSEIWEFEDTGHWLW
jgi:hypothetical protein